MAGGEYKPLKGTPPKEDPGRSRQNDASRIDAVAEGAVPRPHDQNVAKPNPIEPEEWVRMRDPVAGDGDRARLAGKTRLDVMAGPLRKDPLRRPLVERELFVESRNRQDAQTRSQRRLCGGSGMERCKSSNRHGNYGVNANRPDDTVASLPRTPAVRAWLFLAEVACVTVTGGVPRTPEVGGELLGAAGLFVGAAVVPSVAVVVAGPLVVVVVALPFVVVVLSVVVTSCVVTAGSVVVTTSVVVGVARQ
jgi:hypothetical protein